jgi:hypothetical protein
METEKLFGILIIKNFNFKIMKLFKNIRKKIAVLVCGIALLAGTVAIAAEPVSYKLETCVHVCGVRLFCVSGGPNDVLYAIEDFLNGILGC